MKRIPIIIDTDPGVDDAFCLALACCYCDIFDIKAVTTIGGNNVTSVTTQNALDLLKLYKTDVLVYAGENRYLREDFGEPVEKFHGKNGLGNAYIEHNDKKAEEKKAYEAIYDICKENSNEIILVTVGPETNLAKAFERHPDLKKYVKKIVVMGGAIGTGNVTPYAEANIGHDAYAADIVFRSGVPIDMVGLNVTRLCPLSLEEFEKITKEMNEKVKEFLKHLIVFRNGEPLHDAIALATLIDDSFIKWINADIRIELENESRFGETIVKENSLSNIRAAVDANQEGYVEILKRLNDYYR